jgi:hypothetical protein
MVSLAILDVFVTDSFYDFLVYSPRFALVSHTTVRGQISSPSIFGGKFAADARTAPDTRQQKNPRFAIFSCFFHPLTSINNEAAAAEVKGNLNQVSAEDC